MRIFRLIRNGLGMLRHHVLVMPLIVTMLVLLYLLRPIVLIRVIDISEHRIGELAAHADLLARQIRSGIGSQPKGLWTAVVGNQVSNKQLLKMYKEHFRIVQNEWVRRLVNHPLFKRSPFYYYLPFPETEEDYEHFKHDPVLTFTDNEENKGKNLLREIGIPDGGWFVCFYARDPAYLAKIYPSKSFQSSDYRNSSIENIEEAMKYVSSLGGYAVRMGAAVSKPLNDIGDPRIIDYATKHRSDFGDIFLMAKCKFCVAGSSGLLVVSNIFDVPVVKTNMTPYYHGAWGAKDLFLFKLHWSSEKQRILTLEEILGTEVADFSWSHHFVEAGIELIENSPEDLLKATIEMNERLDGNFKLEEADDKAQNHFRSLIQPRHKIYNSPTQMSTSYMRAHPEILSYESVA